MDNQRILVRDVEFIGFVINTLFKGKIVKDKDGNLYDVDIHGPVSIGDKGDIYNVSSMFVGRHVFKKKKEVFNETKT